MFSLCVSVSTSKFTLFIRTWSFWIRAHHNDLMLTNHLQKLYFQISHIPRYWGLGLQNHLGEHSSTHSNVYFSDIISSHSPSYSSHTGLYTVPRTSQWHPLHRDFVPLVYAEKPLHMSTIIFSFRSQIRDSGSDHPVSVPISYCPIYFCITLTAIGNHFVLLCIFWPSYLEWILQDYRDPDFLLNDISLVLKTVPIT